MDTATPTPYPRIQRGTVVLLGARGLHVVVRRDELASRVTLVLAGVEVAPVANVGAVVEAPPWEVRPIDKDRVDVVTARIAKMELRHHAGGES